MGEFVAAQRSGEDADTAGLTWRPGNEGSWERGRGPSQARLGWPSRGRGGDEKWAGVTSWQGRPGFQGNPGGDEASLGTNYLANSEEIHS